MGELININSASQLFKRPDGTGSNFTEDAYITGSTYTDGVAKKSKLPAEPIKSLEDIQRVSDYFILNKQYRNNLLFILGINLGLRCGDLLRLKIGNLINRDGSFRESFKIEEHKSRKHDAEEKDVIIRAGKTRICTLNTAIYNAAELYLTSLPSFPVLNLEEYLFTNQSRNCNGTYSSKDEPITTYAVETMLKKTINKELGIKSHAGTHLMRKTFAYHFLVNQEDRSRGIEKLQIILNHTNPASTLHYIGVTQDEIRNTCVNLNLGLNSPIGDVYRTAG